MNAAAIEAPIDGICPHRFEEVRRAFVANFAIRDDVGASVAVAVDGELIIDLWGGWTDETRATPWDRDTIAATFSSTKTAMALCALWLADQGELDVDAPLQRYWPEFSAAEVTTRHCLAHTAGLPGWDEPLAVSDLYDWERCTTALARQAPWWKPGSAYGYHALTQGYLVGEVVRRITGRPIGRLLADEFTGPLGIDYHMGLDPIHDSRIAPILPPPPEPEPPVASLAHRITSNPAFTLALALEPPFRRAQIPAGNGFGNARALARLQSVLACQGESGRRRLMSRAGALAAASPSWQGIDQINKIDTGFGLGFALNLGPLKFGAGRSCYWGGAGGSLVVVDYEARMAFAYVMNRLKGAPFGDPRNMTLIDAVYRGLATG